MKAIILIYSLIHSQLSYSARICETYIPDEWPSFRYVTEGINGENIVTDNKTELVWKQCSEGLSGAECATGSATSYTWQNALETAEMQNISGFAGYSDWRLPNVEELRSLAALNCYNPSINETVFPNTPSDRFWSSSPLAGNGGFSWVVRFDYGNDFGNLRFDGFRARLVRSAQ